MDISHSHAGLICTYEGVNRVNPGVVSQSFEICGMFEEYKACITPCKDDRPRSSQLLSPTIPSTAIPSPRPKAIDFFDATACHPLPTQRKSTPELVIPTEGDYWGKLNYQKRSEKIDFEVLDEFFCCET
jgi:hypothetical protein